MERWPMPISTLAQFLGSKNLPTIISFIDTLFTRVRRKHNLILIKVKIFSSGLNLLCIKPFQFGIKRTFSFIFLSQLIVMILKILND